MSTAAIEEVLSELRGLPESDQQLVLSFVKARKQESVVKPVAPEQSGRNPALKLRNGRLVFTGKLEQPHVDWLQVVRDEREDEFIRQALGLASAS